MKTVLLCEDNEDILELVKLVLAESGYRLVSAKNGIDAVKMCLDEKPDLVLMDLNMPGLNGFDTMRRLRCEGFTGPMVVLTGSSNEGDRRKAMEAGCNEFIVKTLEMKDVQRILDHYLAEGGSGLE